MPNPNPKTNLNWLGTTMHRLCLESPPCVNKCRKKYAPTKKPSPSTSPTGLSPASSAQVNAPPPTQDPASLLYIILPYFNYCKYHRRRQLFLEFVARYGNCPGVALIVVEAAEQGSTYDLPNPLPGATSHFRCITSDRIWIKENLINMGVRNLPEGWRYMAWIDADLTFVHTHWVRETIAVLDAHSVAQMFQTCVHLGPTGEVFKTDKGFAYQHLKGNEAINPNGKYTDWHCGFAWACTRAAFDGMGGLIDWAILGSGDRHMALAWIGKAKGSCPGNLHPEYALRVQAFQERCEAAKITIGCVNGTVLHHWHGRLADRKYKERWAILASHKYQPSKDLQRNPRCGILQLTEAGRRMTEDFSEYFVGRKEDRMET